MSEEEDGGEKAYEATQQRLDEARKKGDTPNSKDLAALATYVGLLIALFISGAGAMTATGEALASMFAHADTLAPLVLTMGGAGVSLHLSLESVIGLAPLFVLPFLLVLLVIFAQQSMVFALDKIMPKLSRISPIAGAKQKFGVTGTVEFLKATTKLTIISIVLTIYLIDEMDTIVGSARAAPQAAPSHMAEIAFGLLVRITVVVGVIAVADFFWQRFDHARKLRMTYQELKDEHKQSEGDPQTKAQRQRRAQEIATNQMMHDVPKADVIIVNPTHYAVALRWARGAVGAPVLVAKGVDGVALRIRQVAEESGVPIHSDAPTARAIEATVDIGREIDPAHYHAVAAAIRFAEAMRRKAKERG